MIHLLLKSRSFEPKSESDLFKFKLIVNTKNSNIYLFSNVKIDNLVRLQFRSYILIAIEPTDSEILKQNGMYINQVLENGCNFTDLMFIIPSISGFGDCIMVKDDHCIVVPSFNSNYTLYSKTTHEQTLTQKRLQLLANSILPKNYFCNNWDLVPRLSVLFISNSNLSVSRLPRLYSISDQSSLFDQLVSEYEQKTCLSHHLIEKSIHSYLNNKLDSSSFSNTIPTLFEANMSCFQDNCNDLSSWIAHLNAVHEIEIEIILLYYLCSNKKFVNLLLRLYMTALSSNVNSQINSGSYILSDWYLQSLCCILAPQLHYCINRILSQNKDHNPSNMYPFEVVLPKLLVR